MILAIDTLFMSDRFKRTGTGVYLRHLLSQFISLVSQEFPKLDLHTFAPPNSNWDQNGLNTPILHIRKTRTLNSTAFWLVGGLALQVARVRADLVFLPTAQHSFPGWFAPAVTTILDAIPQRLPANMNPSSARLRAMTWINARQAHRIITISDWSKRDLIEIYGLDPQKIKVTHLGYDSTLFNSLPADPQSSKELLSRLGIRPPYILHHGTVQLRKNVHRLIEAWSRIHEASPDFDMQLVLAGAMGQGHEEILKLRDSCPHRVRILMIGELSDRDLALLIKNAFLCVIPSLYEGFCLPMLEAMACGIPTVVSNSSCLPEVSGNVLEYFQPDSVEDMSFTIRRALEDSSLRERLRQNGLGQASNFSWERCARETLQILNAAAEDVGPRRY